MKIVIPTADYPPIEGGISTVTVQLARAFARMGHEVVVIAPHFDGMSEFDANEPVRVLRSGGYHLGWLRTLPMLRATWPELAGCELLIAINVTHAGLIGLLAKQTRGVPYVTLAYAYEFLKFDRVPVLGRILRAVYRNSKVTIAISAFTRDALIRFGLTPASVDVALPGAAWPMPAITHDVNVVCTRLGVHAGRVILAVGRLISRKGHDALLDALPRVLTSFPDTQLVIVGRGPCEDSLHRRCRELDIQNSVVFTGHITDDDVNALYARCDVFALPCGEDANGQVEGFGLVFAEAAAHGKPCIGGRSGGVVDAIVDGETGFLIPPKDAHALADALMTLFNDPARALAMGQAGQERIARELNWDCFAQRLLAAVEARR